MDGVVVGALTGAVASDAKAKDAFTNLVTDADKGPVKAVAQTALAGPVNVMPVANQSSRERAVGMPDDKDFLVVEDVAVEELADGEEVTVVSGEAVTAVEADAIAASSDALIVPLSELRLSSRSISGSMFASMLIDQRNGILPNPFSLMRLPEQSVSSADAASVQAVGEDHNDVQDQAMRDVPVQNAMSMGREMSRTEASISGRIDNQSLAAAGNQTVKDEP